MLFSSRSATTHCTREWRFSYQGTGKRPAAQEKNSEGIALRAMLFGPRAAEQASSPGQTS